MLKNGFTLIELMVVVAVIAVLSAIAIPAYDGYAQEARWSVARASMSSIRIVLEDHNLDEATYVIDGATRYDEGALDDDLGWTPDGDGDTYTYSVENVTATSYDILVVHDDTGDWARCDGRMARCCYEDGAVAVAACPVAAD